MFPSEFGFRQSADRVDCQIGAAPLLLVGESDADEAPHQGVECESRHKSEAGDADRTEDLRQGRNATHAAELGQAEDAGSDTAPEAAEAVQRPDPEHVVDLEPLLGEGEAAYENDPGHC